MKVYTKGGDGGETSLIGGVRVAKDDARVEAYGTVDELSAFIALLRDKLHREEQCAEMVTDLERINSTLMSVEALLASSDESLKILPQIDGEVVEYLEKRVDKIEEGLPTITKFTIPGGDERVSLCHVCRTVCRRAERRVVSLKREHAISPNVEAYLNRLSDYFYVLGREVTKIFNIEEREWMP